MPGAMTDFSWSPPGDDCDEAGWSRIEFAPALQARYQLEMVHWT
jgi:hypothetical protein